MRGKRIALREVLRTVMAEAMESGASTVVTVTGGSVALSQAEEEVRQKSQPQISNSLSYGSSWQ